MHSKYLLFNSVYKIIEGSIDEATTSSEIATILTTEKKIKKSDLLYRMMKRTLKDNFDITNRQSLHDTLNYYTNKFYYENPFYAMSIAIYINDPSIFEFLTVHQLKKDYLTDTHLEELMSTFSSMTGFDFYEPSRKKEYFDKFRLYFIREHANKREVLTKIYKKNRVYLKPIATQGICGFDFLRMVDVVVNSYRVNYISASETRRLLTEISIQIESTFTHWHSYFSSLIIGKTLMMQEDSFDKESVSDFTEFLEGLHSLSGILYQTPGLGKYLSHQSLDKFQQRLEKTSRKEFYFGPNKNFLIRNQKGWNASQTSSSSYDNADIELQSNDGSSYMVALMEKKKNFNFDFSTYQSAMMSHLENMFEVKLNWDNIIQSTKDSSTISFTRKIGKVPYFFNVFLTTTDNHFGQTITWSLNKNDYPEVKQIVSSIEEVN